jgi:uncharacterized pyridoxamine 5'-phosphate oxidase family protein
VYNINKGGMNMTEIEKINKINDTLSEIGTFYFVTSEDNIPHARPVSFKMVYDNKLYLGIGKFKDAYKQALKNNHIELVGCKGATWVRIDATLEFVDDPKAVEECFKIIPGVEKFYKENNYEMGMMYLVHGHFELKSVIDVLEEFNF